MVDTPASNALQRAQLLSNAIAAQPGPTRNDPSELWYRQGVRDAYAYAAALTVTGEAGAATQAAADRVVDLLDAGVTDLAALIDATDTTPRPASALTWVGQLAFDHVAKDHPGIDHDLGFRWGPRHDIRISHRLTDGASTGLLYAYDRTWDEYAVLDPAARVDAVNRAFHAAVDLDPHLPPDRFLALVRGASLPPAQAEMRGVER